MLLREKGFTFHIFVHNFMIVIDSKYQSPSMNLKEFSASKIKQ